MFNIKKKNIAKLDIILVAVVILLCVYGLIVLNSATLSLSKDFMRPQIIATILGLLLMIVVMLVDVDYVKRLYLPIYIISIALLVLVLFIGVGDDSWGARSWVRLGPLSFQPSEFAKLGIIISLAQFINLHKKDINKPLVLLKILVFAFLPVGLILKQPDAGTSMVFIFFICVMLFIAGISYKYIFGAVGVGIISLPIIYMNLDPFQKNRILNFLDPARDVSNTGYQAIQGKIAIGSGQLFGKGLFQGTQTQFGFIPARETDYIFSVLVEELGFIGGIFLIVLYFILLYRCVVIARKTQDTFSRLLCLGFAAMFLFHIFENIGMTIGVMPITGIPLPFFSYGGTFQLINLVAIGIILSISIQKEPLDFR